MIPDKLVYFGRRGTCISCGTRRSEDRIAYTGGGKDTGVGLTGEGTATPKGSGGVERTNLSRTRMRKI